jgi:hypothetical protein
VQKVPQVRTLCVAEGASHLGVPVGNWLTAELDSLSIPFEIPGNVDDDDAPVTTEKQDDL